MKQININDNNQGQRVDKFLMKLLPGMSKSFCYKMFRKKNITLNGKKIKGNEILGAGDQVKVFFADETFTKFSIADKPEVDLDISLPDLVYEDDQLLILNKACGIFSQPDPRGVSVIDQIKAYHHRVGNQLPEGFVPGVANRLDRNTSGIMISGKTQKAIQEVNRLVMAKSVDKRYRTIVLGVIEDPLDLKGYLTKNANRNKVALSQDATEGDFIHTIIRPIRTNGKFTELDVAIMTGKSHQIRAHLAGEGHPIIGDGKYGDHKTNKQFRQAYNLRHHLLHAYSYRLIGDEGFSAAYSDPFIAPVPDLYARIAKGLFHG